MRRRAGRMLKLYEVKPQIRRVWRLSVPAVLTQLATIAMQYIDSAMVGSLGAAASASIGLMASSTWLLSGLCTASITGFTVQVAQHIGAREEKKARSIMNQGFVLAIVFGALICYLLSPITNFLIRLLNGKEKEIKRWLAGRLK